MSITFQVRRTWMPTIWAVENCHLSQTSRKLILSCSCMLFLTALRFQSTLTTLSNGARTVILLQNFFFRCLNSPFPLPGHLAQLLFLSVCSPHLFLFWLNEACYYCEEISQQDDTVNTASWRHRWRKCFPFRNMAIGRAKHRKPRTAGDSYDYNNCLPNYGIPTSFLRNPTFQHGEKSSSRRDRCTPTSYIPRSKIPKLRYGGLQSPNLHCFASSLNINYTEDTPQASTQLKATAKSLPSPSTFRKIVTSLHSTANKGESDSEWARSSLRDIFYDIGFSSKPFCEIHNSASIDQRINRIADSLGTGGLLMYIQVWNHWACWRHCHSHPAAEAPLSLVLDPLHASDHRKKKKDSKPSRTRMMTHQGSTLDCH